MYLGRSAEDDPAFVADLRQHAPPKSIGALKALLSVMFDSVAKGCADSNIFRPRQTGAVFNWII